MNWPQAFAESAFILLMVGALAVLAFLLSLLPNIWPFIVLGILGFVGAAVLIKVTAR